MTATKAKSLKTPKTLTPRAVRKAVTESNLRKTAARVLTSRLVSTEIQYLQRTLGNSATQQELDDKVLAVRSMPWSSIVLPD
ncbi:MAG TPA: hypothetical protein VMU84_13290 [Thermoanaerobaculia bacterium]|nr:hypothetical protein [Thermoanaerobaculia bacterium]